MDGGVSPIGANLSARFVGTEGEGRRRRGGDGGEARRRRGATAARGDGGEAATAARRDGGEADGGEARRRRGGRRRGKLASTLWHVLSDDPPTGSGKLCLAYGAHRQWFEQRGGFSHRHSCERAARRDGGEADGGEARRRRGATAARRTAARRTAARGNGGEADGGEASSPLHYGMEGVDPPM